MTIQEAIEEFLLARSADGLRIKTLTWYESLLKKFRMDVGNLELPIITPNHVRAYLVHLRNEAYSDDTVHGHTRALHAFFRWCAVEYELPNPMVNISYPKQPRPKLPKAVTPEDVIKLLATCDDSEIGIRDKAILAFMMDTGCRASELCDLTMDGLNMDLMRAWGYGKGGKRRLLLFTETTAWLLHRWLTLRNKDEATVFHSSKGGALKPNGLYQMTERRKKRAGVERANPHAFRHGFAVAYILDGGDLATLSRILGHDDVSTTARFYAVFVMDELKQMHHEHSPMRKIKK